MNPKCNKFMLTPNVINKMDSIANECNNIHYYIVAITNSMIVLQMSLSSVLTNLYQFLAKQYFSELATPFSSLYLFIPKIASFQTEFYFLIELEYRRQRKTQD